MNMMTAAVAYAFHLMDVSNHKMPYDKDFIKDIIEQIVPSTSNNQELETLIKIARWESGGFNPDVVSCKVKGDHGLAHGLFQVHPWNENEASRACSKDIGIQADLALERVRMSVSMCKRFGKFGSDLLTGYTVGHCVSNEKEAALRWGTGKTIKKLLETEDDK